MRSMNNGISTAYSGLRAQMDALDVLSNNLANLNTAGFKEELAYFSRKQPEDGSLNSAINSSITTQGASNFLDGSLLQTYRNLDVAIEGNGFLVIQTPQGIRYTRNGSLKQNGQGLLCASEGSPVVGASGGPITLGPGKINIGVDGTVSLDGNKIDQIKIAAFNNPNQLTREGNSLYMMADGKGQETISEAKIKSGFLEQSNVNPLTSIVRMVEITRKFEAIQKTMNLIINDIDSKSIDKLGR
jgi:flagellar basal-body rod protein FlgF